MRLLFVLSLITSLGFGQQRVPIYDLSQDWKVMESGAYVDYGQRNSPAEALYFSLDANRFRGYDLEVDGARDFSVWVNGKLIRQAGAGVVRFDIDSLSRLYRTPLTAGVYARKGLSRVKTFVVAYSSVAGDDIEQLRQKNYLRDFSVLGVFILFLGFLVMLRFNRRLLFDYFDITKLFSLQERDESLVAGRITSRFSILIYVYLSAWCAYLFLITFQHVEENWIIINDFTIRGVGDAFWKWGQLTVAIGVILFIKVSIVLSLAIIFRLREGGSVQVLNYFRLISFLLMVLSVILVFYFVLTTKSPSYYQGLIILTAWIMVGWGILIFLKLLNKSTYSVFHLFSYLCASEFFPMIILFKSLFF
ncbi:MAG TPA: DUF4271 domain-containing protein [Cyclobacteriaceae bacterium]|nr:DUF4271 domain-containing protein [Cyclobacteriaceae bacterium]